MHQCPCCRSTQTGPPSCELSRNRLAILASGRRDEEERSPPLSVCIFQVARGRFVFVGHADRVHFPASCGCEEQADGARVCDCIGSIHLSGPECCCVGCQVCCLLASRFDQGFTQLRYIPRAAFGDSDDAHVSRCADSTEDGARPQAPDLPPHAPARRPQRLAIDEVD